VTETDRGVCRMEGPMGDDGLVSALTERAEAAERDRDAARTLVGGLVSEMERWGAEGDGVPEDCAAYDAAKAAMRGGW